MGGLKGAVKKAVVLAAGLGTRLRPFTDTVPKPLMPVWGEPMLARIVAMLRRWGVEEITVNAHHLHEQVEAWCAANDCRVSYEPEILGTGGVLGPLREWLGTDDFYLVNGDIVVEELEPLEWGERSVAGVEVIAECCVTEAAGPRTIEVEPESGLVTNWKSADAGLDGTFTYCGIALLSCDIFEFVKPGASSIVDAYEAAMAAGRFVRAHASADMLWTDAGTLTSYLELNRDGDDNAYADIPQLRAAFGPTAAKIEFLGARGSDRVFFRAGDAVAILYDDSRRGENARYAGHARYLAAHGVKVPAVLKDDAAAKTLVMEFGGESKPLRLEEAVKAVERLAAFNALGAGFVAHAADVPELEPPFDAALYRWERELFAEYCAGGLFRREVPAAVMAELEGVAERLLQEPPALVHRDFQSTNILWRGNEPCFIDFQGMRLGAAAYDLASLLYDPYAEMLPAGEVQSLVRLYARASGRSDIAAVLPLAAVERLVQCLGAYGRLASVGQTDFLKWVPVALTRLKAAASAAALAATAAFAHSLSAALGENGGHGHGCHCGHHHHH